MSVSAHGRPRIAIDCRKIDDFGIGTYIRNLVRELAEIEGDEEYLLILRTGGDAHVPRHPRFRQAICDAPNYSIRELVAIANILERDDVDLFHAPHYVVPFTRRAVVVTIHDLIHLRVPADSLPAGGRAYAKWMIRRAAKKASIVIAPTAAVAREIEHEFPGVAREIVAIPLGVDPVFLSEPPAQARAIVARLGLSERRFALYAGNDKPHKNLDALLNAWRAARESLPDAKLVLAGVPGTSDLDEDDVVRAGYVSSEELAALVRAATCAVQPSLVEGFGLPVIEAMSCGTPVIASNIDALVEVCGDAAKLVDPHSTDAITSAIIMVMNDDTLRVRMRDAGVERASNYAWSTTAKRTLECYRRALEIAVNN